MSRATERYRLRPARPDDIPHILGLMREMAEFEQLTDIFVVSQLLQLPG
ncbi:hypothetical protein PT7_3294 [Pusillimonas sp. T7-7]|nr:hypothetical protein PT7_3294 [Pusillimonas sp. T7-7]